MKLIGPFRQILTMDNLPERGPIPDHMLQIITDGGVLELEGIIQSVGNFQELKKQVKSTQIEFLEENYVAFPGLIDSHTHICWMGSRANDYALRLGGKSYLDIASMGGGIWDTVTKTRLASLQDLTATTVKRADKLLEQGITTIEVKSGYGLAVEPELKILQAIRAASGQTSADLISTCLAAHIIPKDFQGGEEEYLDLLLKELLPVIREKKLTQRIDIFVETTAFSIGSATKYLKQASKMGFQPVVHGDQFTTGVASLANEVGAVSIDHLEAADDKEIALLAKGNTIPVVLPGASLGLGEPFAPARKLLNAGTSLVIASDWNPGSAPMGNLLMQAAVLSAAQKLTNAETWAGITNRAAMALRLKDRGILTKGRFADIVAFRTNDYREILYNQGQLHAGKVWKKGAAISLN